MLHGKLDFENMECFVKINTEMRKFILNWRTAWRHCSKGTGVTDVDSRCEYFDHSSF